MSKVFSSNKGSSMVLVLVISALVLVMLVPIMSIAMNTLVQTKSSVENLERVSDVKSTLVIMHSLLLDDASYFSTHAEGTLNRSTYITKDTVYTEETVQVYNSGTGLYDTVVSAYNYVYTIELNKLSYKLHARSDLQTGEVTVALVK